MPPADMRGSHPSPHLSFCQQQFPALLAITEGQRVDVGPWVNCFNAHLTCRSALRVLAMAERAIILIPDISGFTGFTGATEIDHAAHITTELLELIVASNETDFTLAEIEGDAVLFYRKDRKGVV